MIHESTTPRNSISNSIELHQVRFPQDGHQVLAIEVVPILASLLSASVQRNSHLNSEHTKRPMCAGKASKMMNVLL